MNGCIRIIRNHRMMSCWTKGFDDYVWTLVQAIEMLPDTVEIRAGWATNDGTAFTEDRYTRIEGEERIWTRTH